MNFRSRYLLLILSLFTCFTIMSIPAHAKTPASISIYLDGNKINADVPPYITKSNVTMVPLSVISKNLGAGVAWSQSTKTATIKYEGLILSMTIGQKYALVNGAQVALDSTVQAINGRIMVPIRFVSQQMKLLVTWYQSARTIKLQTQGGTMDNSLKGAWVSTVYNLDWPSDKSYGKSQQQQQEYIQLLDELQAMGLNTAFVQVRPSADSFYPSQLVPWSKFVTGKQGVAPDYDPLAFMIEETHRRGMEFHAWFNPFRASMDGKIENLASNHVAVTHPDWIVKSGSIMYINPGIPEARQHIIDVILEVVNNYEVDGVHLDDYFYPSSGVFDDDATYLAYNVNNLPNKADWRRDNINLFVEELSKAIHKAKPKVRFGISPFGVWRNQETDASGSDTKASVTAYDNMHADVRTWIKQEWVDYIVPQIYWSMSLKIAQYDKLVDWWANEVRGTNVDLYIGHAPYKLGTKEAGWDNAQEIINQLKYNEKVFEVKGDIFFSAKDMRRNPLGLIPLLKAYYKVSGNN
ncbi:family 10 glycosylhydrolase [Cohnella cholangitidis]|uniref:Family 10 glycosylhydrolase n=1 Tax=Cohnella cholangitidis TaxID=2598458 RepID=A0A7G5C6J6_9BACL|nr:family 10 glycosylhydrolase [Cohnella cholangitidis]QMV44830.1 family 10 glycosylhydrolase [Cohnella cholangitidis]